MQEILVKRGRRIQRRKHAELDTISKRLVRLFFQLDPKDSTIAVYDGDFDCFAEYLSERSRNLDESNLAEKSLLQEKEFGRISANKSFFLQPPKHNSTRTALERVGELERGIVPSEVVHDALFYLTREWMYFGGCYP